MSDPWLPLLHNLPLSRTEREVVKRFEADPHGRAFLPVADILRSHRLVDESLELLMQGVERHPGFTVARVVLARELLHKGMVEPAWRLLEESPVPLGENVLAQKLRFRLAALLGREAVVKATAQHLGLHQMMDAETKQLSDLLEVSGLGALRERLHQELRAKGIEWTPEEVSPLGAGEGIAPATSSRRDGADRDPGGQGDSEDSGPTRTKVTSLYLTTEGVEEDPAVAGFHVVPLAEIFRPGDGEGQARGAGSGVELDSTTLAEIYARQGHYGKALEIYRRLLRLSPHNDLVRRKVSELSRLEREQRDSDLSVDPALVDRMESVEIIDRQIKFYNDLLSRLL